MACYHPIAAYQARTGDLIKIGPPLGTANLALPCGKCIGCRTAYATQWAHRCEHEASLAPNNSFLTLTYDDKHLPPEGHLVKKHLQTFIKKVRKHAYAKGNKNLATDTRRNIRYFACGEYGERSNRPHYHAILFNAAFTDTVQSGEDLLESGTLGSLWPYGAHKIGTVSAASASYIAQYSLKKIGSGDCDADGVWRPPPFLRMSLRPAIGKEWLQKYHQDLAHGYIINNGHKHAIPRYYQKRIKEDDPDFYAEIQQRKQQHLINHPSDNNEPARQADAEIIHHRRKQIMEQRKL